MVLSPHQPPNNFRDVDIYPTQDEILGNISYVRKNIIKGNFQDTEQYLDIQFRLLREDFIANLRESIENYHSKQHTKGIEIYENVKISRDTTRDCLKIAISSEPEDKKFMNGSLLLFTKNHFANLFLCKVLQRKSETGEILINPINLKPEEIYLNQYYTMAECSQYFDPYFQVLTALQNISLNNFPMEKYIVHVNTTSVYMPKYLIYSSSSYQIAGRNFPPEFLPNIETNLLGLNDAQFLAFKAALTQEFVVIQGPPGTGKTHLGVKIAETLIKNSHFWYRNTPMLIVSHKNDALDKFLEELIPITDKLIRVGGQSKSQKLKKYNLNQEKRQKDDYLSIMQKSLVVGMTTSIAARWKGFLERLKNPIVIVEEAAEVLEAHVVSALTNSCQHLILLGDHQQLQPLSADQNISRNYHLGISLFERMVLNGIQCYQLDIQHRMRPEISKLLKARIYPFLVDDESVKDRPDVKGVEKNLFFVDHKYPEETCSHTTKKNIFEAKFLVALARYLVLNGHDPGGIVILATYGGQFQELESLRHEEKYLRDIKISTLDGFQGQEGEIVLLSLVRSDAIGFLSKENRVCVALSRAKNGLYIMGNMNLLTRSSRLWSSVKRCLETQNSIGTALVLRCQVHKVVTKIESLDDFWMVRNGGCSKKCGCLLVCGHVCCLLCHTNFMQHKCVNACVKSVAVQDPQIRYSNLRRNVRNDYQVQVREETNLLGLILGVIRDAVTSLVRFVVERFF